MSNPSDHSVEKTVIEQPATVRTEYGAPAPSSSSNAGWWIAAIVAVVAVVGLVFMFSNNPTSQTDLQAAQDAGRSQAMMETATAQAQSATLAASQASADAASSMAGATQAAADNARVAADRTAQATRDAAASAQDAAQDAAEAPLRP